MKILGILQNLWVKDPIATKRLYDDYPRHRVTRRLLFGGCKSGNVLRQGFGDLCSEIIWEQASPEIGNQSAAAFTPEFAHIYAIIIEHKPDVIVAFGRHAQLGLRLVLPELRARITCDPRAKVIFAPHPTARQSGITTHFKMIADELRTLQQRGAA